MVKRTRPTRQPASPAPARPELNSEFANRLRDPFETTYMGVIESNDPLLMERGNAGVAIYRDLKRDGKVFDGLQKRQLALIGKAWQVEPREESETGTQDAETVNAILKACNFDKLCTDLLDALLTGFVVAEIVWTVRDNLVVPERVVKRAQRRFKYVQLGENSPPELHLLTRENMLTGEPVPERKFIVHRVNPEDDNPYGTGLGLQLYWPVFFKRKGVVAWNKLCDRFGSPTPHGKYPRGAGPKEKNTLADALRAMSNDGYLITPEGMDIALLESKLSGNVTTQQALCEYMDDWIGAVLTGQEARSSGGGALAAASKERADVRQDLTQADSDLLSETLNSTLLAWICELNDLVPCQVYRQIKQEEDLKSMAETDKIVSDMGFELSLDAVRARYGAGWDKKPPLATSAPAAVPGQAANFSEPGAAPADGTSRLLGAATVPLMAGWLQQLQQLVGTHTDPAVLQDALVAAYGHLPTAQLTSVMTLAFTLADLQGRDQVVQEQAGA
jgi:phage gp29-like protein